MINRAIRVDENTSRRFATLFDGYKKAYGQSTLGPVGLRGKRTGHSWTERQPLVLERYSSHLEGHGPGLGVIMLREDSSCLFGAIDIDRFDLDLISLDERVTHLGLPVSVCRSKSGGAHLYVFLSTPVAATDLRRALSSWAAKLELASATELFPKQTVRANELDVGNFINLPYFGGNRSERYCVHDGKRLDLSAFLEHAEASRVNAAALIDTEYRGDTLLLSSPPCLQTIRSRGGFADGSKRNGMFSVGVYLRRRFPDDWEDRLDDYNLTMCQGKPLRSDEVGEIKRSLKRKDYSYKCGDQPINAVCDRANCLSRDFGIRSTLSDSEQGPVISSVTRYVTGDTSYWSVEIDGQAVMLDTQTFIDKNKFNVAVANQIGCLPIHISPAKWHRNVDELMRNASVVEEHPDASETGQLWEWIAAYLDGARCTTKNQIKVSGAFFDGEKVHFRLIDLILFLEVHRIPAKKHNVWSVLKAHGGVSAVTTLERKSYNVWSVPVENHSSVQSEPADDDSLEGVPF